MRSRWWRATGSSTQSKEIDFARVAEFSLEVAILNSFAGQIHVGKRR